MDGNEEKEIVYPRPVGGEEFKEEPVILTPVKSVRLKSNLEVLSHIYKKNISAEKGLAMLEQRDQAVAAMAAPEQRHDSLQSLTDSDLAAVLTAAIQAATQQQL